MTRIVCNFSAGAASAVATKLTLAKNPDALIINVEVAEEHPDNARFRSDCERWFGKPIIVLRDKKYNGSAREVWRRVRFMKSQYGMSCTGRIKREVSKDYRTATDIQVLGFTVEEAKRASQWEENNPELTLITPLIDAQLTKSDCLAMLERAGIQLPMMYRLGFENNNCIGCPHGGMGYWNRIREHFPNDFAEVARIQAEIGPGANFWVHKGQRISLLELPPDAGQHNEPIPDCSIFCEFAIEGYSS